MCFCLQVSQAMTGGLLELWTAFACCRCVLLKEKYSPSAEKLPTSAQTIYIYILKRKAETRPFEASNTLVCLLKQLHFSAHFVWSTRVTTETSLQLLLYYYLCLLVRLRMTRLSPAHTNTFTPTVRLTHATPPRSPVPSAKDVERENLSNACALCPPAKTPAVNKSPNHDPFCTYDRRYSRTADGQKRHPLNSLFPRAACSVDPSKGFVSLKDERKKIIWSFVNVLDSKWDFFIYVLIAQDLWLLLPQF